MSSTERFPGGRAPRPIDPADALALVNSDRWRAKVAEGSNGCQEWQGYRDRKGYGQASLTGGRVVLAHRVALVAFLGRDLGTLTASHACHNPRCVNPRHLVAESMAANSLRSPGVVSNVMRERTHCGHCGRDLVADTRPSMSDRGEGRYRWCPDCDRARNRDRGRLVSAAAKTLGLSWAAYVHEYGSGREPARLFASRPRLLTRGAT